MKLVLKTVLLLVAASIYSQNTLQGTTFANETITPLAYVNVFVPQLEKGAITNEKGTFVIQNMPAGHYKIVFSILGYETQSITIKIPMESPLNIKLRSSAIEIEDIIISTPFHKLQSDNVMKVEQEKIAHLKTNGALTLADGITYILGVESISTGLSIGKPVIRGLSSNRVLVYTQGIRLENQQFGDEHGLGISDAGIESVEVIKGPASLLYGSDAIGGVLYLNPERFANTNTLSSDLSVNYFTNTHGFKTNVGHKTSGKRFKFLFRGSLAEHADYKTKNYRVTNTRFKEYDLKTGIGYQKSNFKTEIRYNLNDSKLGIPIVRGTEKIDEQSTNRNPLLPFQNITNHIFSSKSTLFFNTSRMDINLGYIYNNRKEFEEHHDDQEEEHADTNILEAALHMKLKTFNYDVKYYLPKSEKFETIIAVQGMNQTNSNYGNETLIPNATTNDFGVLATSHIHFKKADVQLGIRYNNRTIDFNSKIQKKFNSLNGALGLKTNIATNITARINLATGFRSPNLAELTSFGTHEGTNRFEIGNEDLKSEQNFQTDLALEYKSKHLELFANVFYNVIKDYVYLSPNGEFVDIDPVYLYLQNNAKLYGGEFGFHFHPHPLDWLHFETSFETVTGKQENNNYLPLIPANALNHIIRVDLKEQWLKKGYAFIKLKTAFNQNNVSGFETNSHAYSLLSAGFGGSIKLSSNKLSISISGNNLANKTYINHLSRLKADNIYNLGRNFSLGLTYGF